MQLIGHHKLRFIFGFEMERFDPNTVQEIRDDLDQQQKYIDSIVEQYEQNSIPYSRPSFSNKQIEISNEMSNYGSTLLPTLAGCGVIGCLGLTGYLYDKFKRLTHYNDDIPQCDSPEITNQYSNEVPYTPEDFYSQN